MADQLAGVSIKKFHSVFGSDLKVALEVTLPGDEEITIPEGRDYFPHLVHFASAKDNPSSPVYAVRIYYLAKVEGNIKNGDREAIIQFSPWAYENNAQYHRLCFWAQSAKEKQFWIKLARFGEEKTFGFNPGRPYINLDFFGKKREFTPVFVKIRDGKTMDIVYFVIEARVSEDGVELIIRRVEESEAPPHLMCENP